MGLWIYRVSLYGETWSRSLDGETLATALFERNVAAQDALLSDLSSRLGGRNAAVWGEV